MKARHHATFFNAPSTVLARSGRFAPVDLALEPSLPMAARQASRATLPAIARQLRR